MSGRSRNIIGEKPSVKSIAAIAIPRVNRPITPISPKTGLYFTMYSPGVVLFSIKNGMISGTIKRINPILKNLVNTSSIYEFTSALK